MSRPIVLAFNMNDDALSKLRFACARAGALLRPVLPEEYALSLGVLCGLADAPQEAPAPVEPFADEMLLMGNFSSPQVNRLLTAMKQLRIHPIALKAVLTPTNAAWDCAHLHAELSAERDAFARGEKADHQ